MTLSAQSRCMDHSKADLLQQAVGCAVDFISGLAKRSAWFRNFTDGIGKKVGS